MSLQLKGAIFGVLSVVGIGVGLTLAQKGDSQPIAPEKLLPQQSVIYLGVDGADEHSKAFEQTAAYQALYETGLMDTLAKVVTSVQEQTGGESGIPGQIINVARHVRAHGMSLAVTLGPQGGPPSPWAVLVLHEAGQFEPALGDLAAASAEIDFQTETINGRSVTRGIVPNTPGIQVGWWQERGHLVLVSGMNAVDSAIAVADGTSPNITSSHLWEKTHAVERGFEVTSVGWFDFAQLRQVFGGVPIPIPERDPSLPPVHLNDLFAALGLDTLSTVTGRCGYKGPAVWSETKIADEGPRKGLLALWNQQPITMADLPPLPQKTTAFGASSLDWTKAYDVLLSAAHDVETFLPEKYQGQIEPAIAAANEYLGIDIRKDLLDPLGHVTCAYTDPVQVPLGLGFGTVVSVDDAPALRRTVDKLIEKLEEKAGENLNVRRIRKAAHEIILFEFQGASPALCITDKWLVACFLPQMVETFLMRLDGELPTWEPTAEYATALAAVPKEFSAISVSDPRGAYQLVMGLAPSLTGLALGGLQQAGVLPPGFEVPIHIADIPPSETFVKPLFPNVSVAVVGQDGVTYTSRTSLPGFPLGAMDGGTAIATTGVLVALLLPAVQQAREAARRTRSQNNLKLIGLAMHNYTDVHGNFPEGTQISEKLDPDRRLSWMAKILPFLDETALYEQLELDKPWNNEANAQIAETRILAYSNPGVSANPEAVYGRTDYAGIGGLGKDGPTLPVTSRKAGVFGYNRGTAFRDIKDGASMTMAVAEANDSGPWAQGGKATIRSFTEKPYINGPDGIGGPYRGGMNVLFCDGSVRFLSEEIDPSVVEAMATIRGGEAVGDF